MKAKQVTKRRRGEGGLVSSGHNVFADLGFPGKEAAELKIKAGLTFEIHQRIKALDLTQAHAAERLGLSQPDVSKLMGGRYTGFSVERLLALLNALEVDVDIVLRPRLGSRHRRGIVRVLDRAKA